MPLSDGFTESSRHITVHGPWTHITDIAETQLKGRAAQQWADYRRSAPEPRPAAFLSLACRPRRRRPGTRPRRPRPPAGSRVGGRRSPGLGRHGIQVLGVMSEEEDRHIDGSGDAAELFAGPPPRVDVTWILGSAPTMRRQRGKDSPDPSRSAWPARRAHAASTEAHHLRPERHARRTGRGTGRGPLRHHRPQPRPLGPLRDYIQVSVVPESL
jgi:hypothetical protein